MRCSHQLLLLWLSVTGVCVLGQSSHSNPLLDGLLSDGGGLADLASTLLQQAGLPIGGLGDVITTVGSIYGNMQDRFCTNPSVTPGQKVPGMLYGPQLNITISAGNCSVAKDGPLDGKNVTCYGPSISYSKAPISFVPKHLSPTVFLDRSCIYGKVVGPQKEAEVEVLYSGDEDELVFGSMNQFLQALKSGGLGSIWSIDGSPATRMTAAASATAPLAPHAALLQAQQDAAAVAAVAATTAPGGMPEPGSLEALLQRAGWHVVMHSAQANAPAAAPTQP